MTSNQSSAHDIFWLARYAHNKTAPLFAKAQASEPSIKFSIDMQFSTVGVTVPHIGINAWWDRDGMFQMTSWLENKGDVDRFATKLAADVANLHPLETGIAA